MVPGSRTPPVARYATPYCFFAGFLHRRPLGARLFHEARIRGVVLLQLPHSRHRCGSMRSDSNPTQFKSVMSHRGAAFAPSQGPGAPFCVAQPRSISSSRFFFALSALSSVSL